MTAKPRILAATAQPGYPVLRRLFEEDAELAFVFTLEEAVRRLQAERFDLVVCTVHFDDSRMFDFEREARAVAPQVPFICVRLLDSILQPRLLEALHVSVGAFGGEFIDRQALHRAVGPEAGDAEFRKRVLERAYAARRLTPT